MGLLALARPARVVAPQARVIEAVRIMTDAKIGAVGVTEGRTIVGVFTERDLMRRVVNDAKDPEATIVRDVMSSPVKTVVDRTPLPEAVAIMRAHHIRHLAIVDADGSFAGMIGLRYLLYQLMDDLALKVGDLEGYLMADGPGG